MDKEESKVYARKYYLANKEKFTERNRRNYLKNRRKEEYLTRLRKSYSKRAIQKSNDKWLKRDAFDGYVRNCYTSTPELD